ncbi:MAG: radical SAM protein [Dehalococcoidia bacterium]|nr:MAG: radical SAM protein [Dehalococcoidia bacterium]
MKVYHVVYEPSFKSVDIHFWAKCTLACRACYTDYETLDFGLFDDPIASIAGKSPQKPPTRFLSLDEVMRLLKGRAVDRAIFMGTEAALDPDMPALAKALHQEFHSYNVMLTNGLKLADMTDVDEVIFSIKAITSALHREYTGQDNARILENFTKIARSGKKIQAETVLIPGLIDAGEVERVARFIAGIDRGITLRIDAYFPVGDNPWRAATAAEVEEAAVLARKHLDKISCLTLDMKRTGEKPLRLF